MLRRPIAVKSVPANHIGAYRAALSATASLAHPAAVIVMDVVEHDGALLVVQEFVEGTALPTLLENGFSAERAVGLGLHLARLLGYAHARGIVHGDLTPGAIMVERDNTVRVNNFCLPPDVTYFEQQAGVAARLMRGLSLPSATRTLPNDVLPPSNTPEADVYAIGLLLWRALATTGPKGKARDFRADVPASMRDLVGRLLIPTHPQHVKQAVELIPLLEVLGQAMNAEREENLQETPLLLRHLRRSPHGAADTDAWSEAETVTEMHPLSQPLSAASNTPPDVDDLSPTRPATPSVPLRAPITSRSLQAPPDAYRAPFSGPLRAPGPSGPLRVPNPTGPLRAGGTGRLSVPNPNAPTPQRAPTLSGPLRAGAAGRLDANDGPMPAYRAPVAVPWSDEPQVVQWARQHSRPIPGAMGQSWPARPARSRSVALAPLLLIGVLLFAICLIVGYVVPFVLPFP